jgi:aldehyde:ferredoxin oxidoreductase
MCGWKYTILRVDLTKRLCLKEALDPQIAKAYIGGRGLGIYYLNKELDPKCDPLSPENLLIMATGPLTGTKAATGGRYMVMTKSPLSGALTTSNSGGMFPTEMKRAGFDAILFSGRAHEPVYLWVADGEAVLRPAKHLWGKTVHQTTDQLVTETDPKAKVACIGPAGENLIRFSAIMNDKGRAAGRSGVGAVMGSKNLKAVVIRGDQTVAVRDKSELKKTHQKIMTGVKADLQAKQNNHALYGTTAAVSAMNSVWILPTKNHQLSKFDSWEGGIHQEFKEKYFVKKKACFACPIGCGRMSKVEEPGYEGEGEGPEYETLYAMGSNCLIDNLPAIIKANYLCNELGMDTISMGCTVACAMELVDRGYLTEDEVGQPLRWGDGDALIDLTRKTAYRDGFGDVLAEGSYRMAERYGHPELAMVSKRQDFAGYDPRSLQAMGLAFATSPIGASHMRGDTGYWELSGGPAKVDALAREDKGRLVKIWQDLFSIIDASGLCVFFAIRYLVNRTEAAEPVGILHYLNAITAADYTLDELLRAGERIFNAERKFMAEAGFSRKDDSLPPRTLKEPLPEGPAEGYVCHLNEMLDEYYSSRGWTADGIPKKETLKRLSLI